MLDIGGGGAGVEVGAPVWDEYEVDIWEFWSTMMMITISADARGWPFP